MPIAVVGIGVPASRPANAPQSAASNFADQNDLAAAPYVPRTSGLGAQGGLLQTIQESAAIAIQNSQTASESPAAAASGVGGAVGPTFSAPSSTAAHNFPNGAFPSLGSSGSLAHLGIAVAPFEPLPPPPPLPQPSVTGANTLPSGLDHNERPGGHASGRQHGKRRHHGHKNGGGGGGGGGSLKNVGKLDIGPGAGDVQGTDANADRRAPRRHASGQKTFAWKQVGFSECSKSCGGGRR